MALFDRPAAWSYDQDLFRRATDDETRLESMMAAIAIENEGLWVVESNERPVAFAWTRIASDTVRAVELHVDTDEPPIEPLRLLMRRIEREYAGKASCIAVAEKSLSGMSPGTLREVGFDREGEVWSRRL